MGTPNCFLKSSLFLLQAEQCLISETGAGRIRTLTFSYPHTAYITVKQQREQPYRLLSLFAPSLTAGAGETEE
jgi:hypothetical protein